MIELPNIDKRCVDAELLASHGVAAAGNSDGLILFVGGTDDVLNVCQGAGLENSGNPGGVELRVDVVDNGGSAFVSECGEGS